MRRFSIKVNGVAYDVEVEENGAVSAPIASVPAAAPRAAVQAPVAAPAAAPVAAPAPAATGATGSEVVKAPMPGTIISVNVATGDSVKKGQVLVVLEAMKMENEIVSPVDGTVASINTTKGSSVNAGELLVSLN